MEFLMKHSLLLRRAACVGLLLVSSLSGGLALASGNDGAGSAETGDVALYNTGKGVYNSKLACTGCPMAGKTLDANSARDLLSNRRGVTLNAEESAALDVYLKRRFKL